IPYALSGYKVVKIGDNCFNGGAAGANGYASIKEIIIGEGVEEIGKFAFANLSGLTSMTIPASVKRIGSRAFVSCNNLTELYFKGDIITDGMQNLVSGSNKISAFGPSDSNLERYFARYPLVSYNAYTMPSCFVVEEVGEKEVYIAGLKDHYCATGHTNIDIPEYISGKKVVGIRTHAFEGHTDIYSLSIPATIVDIETAAFYGCTGLKVVKVSADNPAYKYLDGALLSMDGKKMYICLSGDVSYTVPAGVTEIMEGAFDGAINMELLYLNEEVAKIAPDAFRGCDKLERIAVPEQNPNFIFTAGTLFNKDKTLLYIYLYTNRAESYDVPDSVETVADFAFRKAGGLKQIRFASDVTVGESIFGTEGDIHAVIYAPKGSYNVEKAAIYAGLSFYNDITPCLAYEEVEDGVRIVGFTCVDHAHDEINIPLYIADKPVVAIGARAFAEESFNDGYIEAPVTADTFVKGKYYTQLVNYSAFEVATAYSDELYVQYNDGGVIKYSQTYVSESDFMMSATTYYVLVIYDTLYLPADSFNEFTVYYVPFRGVRVGDNVKRIESGAFRGSNLTSIVIGSSVESIAADAFVGSTALLEAYFKSDLTPDTGAFSELSDKFVVYFTEDCTHLRDYFRTLFESGDGKIKTLASLEDSEYCFEYALNDLNNTAEIIGLKNHVCVDGHNDLVVPSQIFGRYTVTSIADHAFEGNTEIIRLTLPDEVVSIGNGALSGCTRLTEIVLSATNPNFAFADGVLFGKELGERTKLIFYTAKNTATSYTVPDGITEIAAGAFYGNEYLKSITVGKDVVTIGDKAFVACASLQNIYVHEANTAFVSTAKYGDGLVGVLYQIKSTLPNGNIDKAALVAYPAGAKSTYVTIGGSFDVDEVRSGAFDSAKYLTMIYFETYVTRGEEEDVFNNVENLSTLKVCLPIGASANGFASYVEGLGITVLRYTSKDCLTFERNTTGYTVTGVKTHEDGEVCLSGDHDLIAVPLYYK
ncbi:MAG: leucine-rich repeat protein, partial [Clostridia bacterium]|nr:leucine-rich repeat protein [Clostridia bacterium]